MELNHEPETELPTSFVANICLIVNNEYGLRKFLAETREDLESFGPRSK